jgi:hypothetical protein
MEQYKNKKRAESSREPGKVQREILVAIATDAIVAGHNRQAPRDPFAVEIPPLSRYDLASANSRSPSITQRHRE